MKKFIALLLILLAGITIASCDGISVTIVPVTTGTTNTSDTSTTDEFIDYAAQLKLDFNSTSLKQEVTVKQCIDGDTTHFFCPTEIDETGAMKTRYLGIDTPESTGKIQPWGKAASNFNKSKLLNAQSIYVESEDTNWNVDSTGSRFLVWVWYRLNETDDYRLLNLEILQEGYAATKNYSSTKYGDIFGQAHNQAISRKLRYYGEEQDPDFDYGAYAEVTIKELRENLEEYVDKNVRFEGLIVMNSSANTYIVEYYDADTETYYGISVYSGYSFSGEFMLVVGNMVSFAGVLSHHDSFGYQISGLTYFAMRPDNPKCIRLLSENNEVKPHTIDVEYFNENQVMAEDTYVKLENLTVVSVYTTTNPQASSIGAMTLTCKDENDNQIQIRTSVLYEEDGETLITADAYENQTIDVVGTIDEYENTYQVHVYFASDIVVK